MPNSNLLFKSEQPREKTFEKEWVIRNWKEVIQDEKLVDNTATVIQCEVDDVMCAKILVGTAVSPSNTGKNRYIFFYWMLQDKHFCLDTIQANLVIETLNGEGRPTHKFQVQNKLFIGGIFEPQTF